MGVEFAVNGRRGFTLVELLVVIAIIGTLISLLLPAVQGVRELGRQVSCKNNIHQLALGIQSYATTNELLPRSGHYGPPVYDPYEGPDYTDLRSGPMLSWIVAILPHIEQQQLFERFDFSRSVLEQTRSTQDSMEPQEFQPAVLLCPSDAARGQFYAHPEYTRGKRFAKANYAAFVSPFHTSTQIEYPGALSARDQRPDDIKDGLTNTLMLSEVRAWSEQLDQRGAWALPWNGSSLLAYDVHPHWIIDQAGSNFTASPYSIGCTQRPNNRAFNVDMLYHCPEDYFAGAQLENMPCGQWAASGSWHFLSAAPRSQHPGGVMVAFAGGSVQFLVDDVDEVLMAYMISINDMHPVNFSEYIR
jgi:prepilin-type N-terminal cleavage/methylation domain-containing protein/prepilin-type processing-associated H-X9-DG protein